MTSHFETLKEARMLTLSPGDQYIIEWDHWDRQRYRVDELRGDVIVCRRWIPHKQKWTDWPVVQKASLLPWSKIERAS